MNILSNEYMYMYMMVNSTTASGVPLSGEPQAGLCTETLMAMS